MRIKCYIDTNVLIYAILHHSKYGKHCEDILKAVEKAEIIGFGSDMVAIELLGALSKISTKAAKLAVEAYYSLNIIHFRISPMVLSLASLINEIVNIRYDAVHLAIMMLNGVDNIITYDLDDWRKAESNYLKIKDEARGFNIKSKSLNVFTPEEILNLINKKKR